MYLAPTLLNFEIKSSFQTFRGQMSSQFLYEGMKTVKFDEFNNWIVVSAPIKQIAQSRILNQIVKQIERCG